jgi:hypothetical protein
MPTAVANNNVSSNPTISAPEAFFFWRFPAALFALRG